MQFFPISLQPGGVFSVLAGKGVSAKAESLFAQLLGRSKGASAASLWEHILALREQGGIDDDLWQRLTDWKKSGEDGRLGAWLAQVCPELLPAGWMPPQWAADEAATHDAGDAAVSAKQGERFLWQAHGGGEKSLGAPSAAHGTPHGPLAQKGKAAREDGGEALAKESSHIASLKEAATSSGKIQGSGKAEKHAALGQERLSASVAMPQRSDRHPGAVRPAAAAVDAASKSAASAAPLPPKDGPGQSPPGDVGHEEPSSRPSPLPAESLWQATSKKVGQSLEAQGLAGASEARPQGRAEAEGRIRPEQMRSNPEAAWLEDPQELSPRAVSLRGSGFGARDGRSGQQLHDERREQMLLAAQGGQATGVEGAGAAAFSPAGPVASRAEALAPSIVEQTAQSMVRQLSPGIKQLTIQIEPQDLGPIHVALQVRGGEVHAVLRPAHPETSQVLNAHLPTLRQELERQGFQVARLDVQTGLADLGSQTAWDGTSQHQRPQGDGAGTGFLWRRSAAPEESLARNLQEGRTPGLHTALRADGAVDLFA
ncbi:MAG: flagellar hook-length control protein FliK [Desulfomicrobiaceae bacterium]|nr:flagellar hook-length control protein FliK [Desulfomicrobiaceae bacterium]